jgi:hypothetical protein
MLTSARLPKKVRSRFSRKPPACGKGSAARRFAAPRDRDVERRAATDSRSSPLSR